MSPIFWRRRSQFINFSELNFTNLEFYRLHKPINDKDNKLVKTRMNTEFANSFLRQIILRWFPHGPHDSICLNPASSRKCIDQIIYKCLQMITKLWRKTQGKNKFKKYIQIRIYFWHLEIWYIIQYLTSILSDYPIQIVREMKVSFSSSYQSICSQRESYSFSIYYIALS